MSSFSVDVRLSKEAGVHQIRRNQATSLILLGVIGSEFPDEMSKVSFKDDPSIIRFLMRSVIIITNKLRV